MRGHLLGAGEALIFDVGKSGGANSVDPGKVINT
jgi:hypothetical protein